MTRYLILNLNQKQFSHLDKLVRLGDGILRALEVARPHLGRYSRLQVGADQL